MKQNTLSVEIDKPVGEVFEFTTNPNNTSHWIASIIHEEVNETPIKVGSIYRNQNREGAWAEYKVVSLKENELFELKEVAGTYSVRYTYAPLMNGGVRLTYFERDEDKLKNPFRQEVLEGLKRILEEK